MNKLLLSQIAFSNEPFSRGLAYYKNDFESGDLSGFVGDWIIGTEWSAGGTNCLKSSNYHKPSTTSTTTLTFTNDTFARFDFDWFVYSEGNYDKFQVLIDGVSVLGPYGNYNGISGHYTNFLLPGTHTVVFHYSKDGSGDVGLDISAIDNILVQEIQFARFIDFSAGKGPFTGAWALSSDWSYDGDGESLASTNHTNSSTSADVAQLSFPHPTWLLGAYKTSSEGGYDKLYVGLDATNNVINGASGNTTTGTFLHIAGESSLLNVSYTKDSSSSAGADTVYVDAFGFYTAHNRIVWQDDFTEELDTLDCYDKVSVTPGTWTHDSSGLLHATGSQSLYLNNQKLPADGYVEAVLTQADNAGIVFRATDSTHYLLMTMQDASSATTPSHVNLYQCIGTTFTSISGSVAIPGGWTRGTEKKFQLQVDGSYLSMHVDGKVVYSAIQTTYCGSSVAAKFGLRADAGTQIFKSIKAVTK